MAKMTKGYYFNKQYKKYHVRLYINGRYFHIGRFDTEQEAKEQRDKALVRVGE